jgi:xanthine dehydrogenase YagR molybdenum-binding subunit
VITDQPLPHDDIASGHGAEESVPAARRLKQRYDGRAKVTGTARYSADVRIPQLAYALIVQSTIANGVIASTDRSAAERAYGVLAILTPFNAPRLPIYPPEQTRGNLTLLQNTDVNYSGQPIAVIVATSLDAARYAATLLDIKYRPQPAKLDFMGRLNEARRLKGTFREPVDTQRGDLERSMAKADVKVEETYVTPIQNHNSMETHSTLAWWDGDLLNLHNSTQSITTDRQTVAKILGISADNVRVQCPYTGGGFGSKGTTWSHVVLAAMAAKAVGRPVKLVLDRNQMFGPVGSRPATVQKIRLGAAADGRLLAVQHDVILHTSVMEDFLESSAFLTRMLYSSEANVTTHRLVEMNLGVATNMRAPGESTGSAALESALDELAVKLKMDPVQLRLINYAEKDEGRDLPFTSKHLRECYKQAGERFGWSRRNLAPGQMLEGNELIGHGMGTATRHANRSAAHALVRILPSGRAFVASGSQELGTGTYTIMADTAAEALGLDPSLIEVKLGDSTLPQSPASTGSQSAASVCPAVRDAARQARLQLFSMAAGDAQSPLYGAKPEGLSVRDGRLFLTSKPSVGESLAAVIARNGGQPIEATGASEPARDRASYTSNSFGAVFAEVAVDRDTHMVKVRRVVGTYDIGILMNETTGMAQLTGGVIWGVSFALHEQAHIDPVFGRTTNANFAEYHVATNADIGHLDLTVLNIPDRQFSPLGARGIGEISITGIVAAIANAIYNATGKRVRHFPITPDKIMQASSDQAKSDAARTDLEEPALRMRRNVAGKTITQQ